MRHVLVVPSWYPTAESPLSGSFFREQCIALSRAGLRVGVVYPEFESLRRLSPSAIGGRAAVARRFQRVEEEDAGVPTLRVRGWNVLPRLVLGGRLWARLASGLARDYVRRHGRPDLVYAFGALWGGYAGARLARTLGVPLVVGEHFSGYTEHFAGYAPGKMTQGQLHAAREAYAAAARVIAVSTALERTLAGAGLVDARRLTVVPNLVDTDFFVPPPGGRPASDAGSGGPRFLAIGNLDPIKGPDLLLRAFSAAFRDDPRATLDFAGSGSLADSLRRESVALGVADRVRFLGQLDRDGVRRALWSADRLVLASHVETFGVVLLEAMATGLPVIATACGGPEDVVTPAVGRLVPVGDADALAAALRAARSEPTPPPAAVREHVLRNFAAPLVVERIADVFDAVSTGAARA